MRVILAVAFGLLIAGCQSATQHAAEVQGAQASGDRLSVGKVQREIRVGMSNAEVVEVLGSPNMVTTDDKRRETWVYDRVSTDNVHSSSSGGVGILVLGVSGSAGASSTSQRTLTILVKFDESSHVRDFAYRSSSF